MQKLQSCAKHQIRAFSCESVVDAVAVNPNSIKTLFANGLSTFPIKTIQVLVTVLKVYLKILIIALFYVIEFLIILY